MKPLMLIGNLRSGTSALTEMLNVHPQIYVSMEAFTIWYLYQNGAFKTHPKLSPPFMVPDDTPRRNPALCKEPLTGNVRKDFFRDVLWVKDHGLPGIQDAYPEKKDKDLRWVGDKSPLIQADPILKSFMKKNFSDAKYIHLVRDPRYAISSMAGTWWKGTPDEIAQYWVDVEKWTEDIPSLLLKHEDICADPKREMTRICEYLDLDPTEAVAQLPHLKRGEVTNVEYVNTYRRGRFMSKITPVMRSLMTKYGYE